MRRHDHGELQRRIDRLARENRRLRAELARLEALEKLAYVDALTGLHNRRSFEERLAQELSRASRSASPTSILLIDLDGLKQINDQGGHAAGDAALRFTAQVLGRACRLGDLACRLGGDEFAVILPDTCQAGAARFAQRLTRELARASDRPRLPAGRVVQVSVGTATAPNDTRDMEALLELADRRMYQVKRSRKARIQAA